MPLPADWQPNEGSAKLAHDKLGEIGAANCLAKFRDHHREVSGQRHTLAGWQTKFLNWVRDERTVSQRELPLMRDVSGARPAQPAAGWQARREAGHAAKAKLCARLDEMGVPPLADFVKGDPPADARWLPVWNRLKAELGDAVTASWFADATLRAFVDGEATVELPTKFKCAHVTTHFREKVLRAIAAEHRGVENVRFVVRTAA